MKALKRFAIVTNPLRDKDMRIAAALKEEILSLSGEAEIYTFGETEEEERLVRNVSLHDAILVLGGDGTILHMAGNTALHEIPVLGVNIGHLGYLASVDSRNVSDAIVSIMRGEYMLNRPMMIEGRVLRKDQEIRRHIALNDIVLGRKNGIHVIHYCLKINGEEIADYRADGMILCTPTGSTAYNMSAGGPVVIPDADIMVLTPICAHDLIVGSIAVNSGVEIELSLCGGGEKEQHAILVFDGSEEVDILPGDRIQIVSSRHRPLFLELVKMSFLERLRIKMNEMNMRNSI